MILQDPQTIRHYQKITDGMVNLWLRRYSFEEIRLYLDGYIACLRNSDFVEQYQIHRLEEQALRFLRDPSNFELSQPLTETETDYN
ncbi:hypothetical protein NIES4102_31140 [Chondrocystis sp. NIES-4102]|nr:hypothetical protein NIES4102_31140 [Chondrocystis sp. NIES-4102]